MTKSTTRQVLAALAMGEYELVDGQLRRRVAECQVPLYVDPPAFEPRPPIMEPERERETAFTFSMLGDDEDEEL